MPVQHSCTQFTMSSQDDFQIQMHPELSTYDINELIAWCERSPQCDLESLSRSNVNEPTSTDCCIAQQSRADLPMLSAEEIQRLFLLRPDLLAPEDQRLDSHTPGEHALSPASASASVDANIPNDEIRRCYDHGCDGRAFSCRENHLRHLRERRLRIHCDSCNASFTRKSNLVAHQKSRCKRRRRVQSQQRGLRDAFKIDLGFELTETTSD